MQTIAAYKKTNRIGKQDITYLFSKIGIAHENVILNISNIQCQYLVSHIINNGTLLVECKHPDYSGDDYYSIDVSILMPYLHKNK